MGTLLAIAGTYSFVTVTLRPESRMAVNSVLFVSPLEPTLRYTDISYLRVNSCKPRDFVFFGVDAKYN